MDFGEEFKCNQCLTLFSQKKTPLKMPNCKHNICKQCYEEVNSSHLDVIQCEFCGVSISDCLNKKLISNTTLLKKIQNSGKKFENTNYNTFTKHNSNF